MRVVSIFLFSIVFLISSAGWCSERTQKQQELKQLKNRIEKLRKTIEVKENSKSAYNRQLRDIEVQIGKVSEQISRSNRRIRQKQKALDSLQHKKNSIEKSIRQHNRQLAQHIYAAYTMGQQEQLKLLFSQQNALELQRNLTYYQYFSRHRVNQIEEARHNFDQLLENEREIQTAKLDLEQELGRQRKQKASLSKDSNKRKIVVSDLEKELKKQGRHLTRLEEDANHLKRLIDSLSDILTDIPAPSVDHQKFSSLRGKLAWPVKGKVKKLFGRLKPPSNLRWQGIIIEAPMGNNVRAVSHGRIAFADWLRGMGNLIIIDHGNGYMSLYGHNQSLYKTTGEWVEAGDIIGSIGNSGGQKQPGLYFEIRKKGKPQNPTRWCHSKNWSAT